MTIPQNKAPEIPEGKESEQGSATGASAALEKTNRRLGRMRSLQGSLRNRRRQSKTERLSSSEPSAELAKEIEEKRQSIAQLKQRIQQRESKTHDASVQKIVSIVQRKNDSVGQDHSRKLLRDYFSNPQNLQLEREKAGLLMGASVTSEGDEERRKYIDGLKSRFALKDSEAEEVFFALLYRLRDRSIDDDGPDVFMLELQLEREERELERLLRTRQFLVEFRRSQRYKGRRGRGSRGFSEEEFRKFLEENEDYQRAERKSEEEYKRKRNHLKKLAKDRDVYVQQQTKRVTKKVAPKAKTPRAKPAQQLKTALNKTKASRVFKRVVDQAEPVEQTESRSVRQFGGQLVEFDYSGGGVSVSVVNSDSGDRIEVPKFTVQSLEDALYENIFVNRLHIPVWQSAVERKQLIETLTDGHVRLKDRKLSNADQFAQVTNMVAALGVGGLSYDKAQQWLGELGLVKRNGKLKLQRLRQLRPQLLQLVDTVEQNGRSRMKPKDWRALLRWRQENPNKSLEKFDVDALPKRYRDSLDEESQ